MPGPDEPEESWDFPELSAPAPDPTSLTLPSEPELIYDTGSDGWWRAQAEAQRAAAEEEDQPAPLFRPMPPIPAFELIEPSVLNDPAYLPSGPSPLDDAYLPPEEVFPLAASEPEPAYEPVPAYEPEPVYQAAYEPEPEPEPEPAPEPAPVVAEAPIVEPLIRTPVLPEPEDDWYDAPPPVPSDAPAGAGGGGGGVGARRALAWAGLALAGVGLLVVAFLLLGKDEPKGSPTITAPSPVASTLPTTTPTVAPTPTATPQATAQPTVSVVPAVPATSAAAAPVVPLTVLNNSRIHHLAERAAAKFRAGGWPVTGTGNYTGKLDTSTIYYPPGERDSALRFAKQFGVRVLPRFSSLPGKGMTVVVTRDFAVS